MMVFMLLFSVIFGDVKASPVDIANPVPTVILLVKLKYGISIELVPSKPTPAKFLDDTNLSEASEILAVVSF